MIFNHDIVIIVHCKFPNLNANINSQIAGILAWMYNVEQRPNGTICTYSVQSQISRVMIGHSWTASRTNWRRSIVYTAMRAIEALELAKSLPNNFYNEMIDVLCWWLCWWQTHTRPNRFIKTYRHEVHYDYIMCNLHII